MSFFQAGQPTINKTRVYISCRPFGAPAGFGPAETLSTPISRQFAKGEQAREAEGLERGLCPLEPHLAEEQPPQVQKPYSATQRSKISLIKGTS